MKDRFAVQKNCFVGIEAEGPFSGSRTLFIPGSCSIPQMAAALAVTSNKIKSVYYGAGNDRKIYREGFEYLKHFDSLIVEFDLKDGIPSYLLGDALNPLNQEWAFWSVCYSGWSLPSLGLSMTKTGIKMIDFLKTVQAKGRRKGIRWIYNPDCENKKLYPEKEEYVTKLDDERFDQDVSIPYCQEPYLLGGPLINGKVL